MYNQYVATCINQPIQPTCINQPILSTMYINLSKPILINLYQSTCTINHVHRPVTTCMKKLALINLYYHKCINYTQEIMSQQPITSNSSTKSYILTKINHQDKSQPYAHYHQYVHHLRILTNINKMYQDQNFLLKVYQVIYDTSSIKYVPTILLASAPSNVPNMYQ
jgi:hypothetical protein